MDEVINHAEAAVEYFMHDACTPQDEQDLAESWAALFCLEYEPD